MLMMGQNVVAARPIDRDRTKCGDQVSRGKRHSEERARRRNEHLVRLQL